MPQVSRAITQSRPLDHMYDPCFTMSGVRNLYRPQQNAVQKKFNKSRQNLSGADRALYLKRPSRPYTQHVPPNVVLEPPRMQERPVTDTPNQQYEQTDALRRTVGVQTMFRESESQTDPYSPDYYIADENGPQPPELQAVHLSYDTAGLPAGLEEVEELARMRRKKEFEASLPPTTDPASLKRRFMLIEQNEAKEWEYRQQQLKDIQEKRLQMIIDEIHSRDAAIEAIEQDRLEKLKLRKRQEVEQAKHEAQKKRVKLQRKLTRSKVAIESAFSGGIGGDKKRDIISDYANYGSEIYAPLKRNGAERVGASAPEANTNALADLEGFRELEARFPEQMLVHPDGIPAEKPKEIVAEKYKSREGQKILEHLTKMEHLLKQTGQAIHAGQRSGVFNQWKSRDVVVRPPTPTVQPPREDGAEKEPLGLLQNLVRGRAAQVEMHLGREARLQLIEELRAGAEETRPATADANTGVTDADLRQAAQDILVAGVIQSQMASMK